MTDHAPVWIETCPGRGGASAMMVIIEEILKLNPRAGSTVTEVPTHRIERLRALAEMIQRNQREMS